MYLLTIGDKAYSSWSLRGWLMLAAFNVKFEEVTVRMYDPAFTEMQAANAPARQVPQLAWQEDGRLLRIWESTAILETLAERHPAAGHWPRDRWARTVARVLVAEMHAGFATLRRAAPMNMHRAGRPLPEWPDGLAADLDRLALLWDWARAETGGPWLAGESFTAADAFYAPVASRLVSYALADKRTAPYAERLLAHPAVARWKAEALADPRRIPLYDDLP